jgi:hypothetical protein
MNEYFCEWKPSEKDNRLHALAKRYHTDTEAYDRTVCTGPVVNDEIKPNGHREIGLISRNARDTLHRLTEEAAGFGITGAELRHAISRLDARD